jgi:hypothetical protein
VKLIHTRVARVAAFACKRGCAATKGEELQIEYISIIQSFKHFNMSVSTHFKLIGGYLCNPRRAHFADPSQSVLIGVNLWPLSFAFSFVFFATFVVHLSAFGSAGASPSQMLSITRPA